MYGLAFEESGMNEIEVSLNNGAHLKDFIAELRQRVPSLEGQVIVPGEDRLADQCTFNIDGRFYYNDENIELKDGCRVRLLTLAVGG